MTRRHRLVRVQWARRNFIWRHVDWNMVLFSDGWANGWPKDGLGCNASRYIDDVLRPHVHNQEPGVTFQHDNASLHTVLITRQFLAQNNVRDVLDRRARKNSSDNTLQDL